MLFKLDWTAFKSEVNSRGLASKLQYIEIEDKYHIWVQDQWFSLKTKVHIHDATAPVGSDQEDFEDNFKSNANKTIAPDKVQASGVSNPDGKRARLKGTHNSTITAGQTKNIDYKMEQLQYSGSNVESIFDGVRYYAKDAAAGDRDWETSSNRRIMSTF